MAPPEDLSIGIVTDLHFGPQARFGGKLRKLTHLAGDLARGFVKRMNDEVRPHLVVNLGDDIEDESREADLERYGECQSILRAADAPLVNVAGNHDPIHLNRDDLSGFWRRSGPLYYSLDLRGWHLVVLHTLEEKGVEVRIPETQLEWLRADLASGRDAHDRLDAPLGERARPGGLALVAGALAPGAGQGARGAPRDLRAARGACARCSTGTCTGTTSTSSRGSLT